MKFKKLFISSAVALSLMACSEKEPADFNAMTFNIRCPVESDSTNYWPNRADYAADLIKFYDVDIVGLQEATKGQIDDFLSRVPGISYIGVGRDDGAEKGEYCPILYKTDRFTLLDSGNFWLSETPDVPGAKGWDADYPRVATWGIFRDNDGGREFLYMNTHLDHIGPMARREGAKMVLAKAFELSGKRPALITGDFNSSPDQEPIRILLSDPEHKLLSARDAAAFVYGPDRTFHDFGRIPYGNQQLIDYIFVKDPVKVESCGVLAEHKGDLYPSDHRPILAKVEI